MTAANAIPNSSTVDRIFGVLAEASTYKRLLFLFVGFPLGMFYFCSMAPLIGVGIGLAPIVVGLAILAAALFIVTIYARLERQLMAGLLGAVFAPEPRPAPRIRGWLLNPAAWKRVLYFALRLPLSVLGFAVAIVMVVSVSLLLAPLAYSIVPMWIATEPVTRWEEAILVACVGAALGLVSAHAVNAVADLERRLAEWLL